MPRVVILCGGQGTRLRRDGVSAETLVDVGGKPILWHIMKLYAHHGFADFVICLGYRGNMIKEYFLNYEAMNNDFSMRFRTQNELTFHDEHRSRIFA
jgi:glucose-1-phosphate cytidylyltransferase